MPSRALTEEEANLSNEVLLRGCIRVNEDTGEMVIEIEEN